MSDEKEYTVENMGAAIDFAFNLGSYVSSLDSEVALLESEIFGEAMRRSLPTYVENYRDKLSELESEIEANRAYKTNETILDMMKYARERTSQI